MKDARIKRYIIDASVALKWFSREDELYVREAENILEAVYERRIILYAPDLLVYEIGNALLKGKRLPSTDVQKLLESFFAIGVVVQEMTLPLCKQTVVISDRLDITFYDAAYMALAARVDAPLISANPKHHKGADGVTVIPLEKWKK